MSESSQKNLAAILDPLRERIQDFQKKVESTCDTETREVLSLKEQIKLMVETSQAIGSQADGLAKALRGDSQLLGRWGEIALERILEAAKGRTSGSNRAVEAGLEWRTTLARINAGDPATLRAQTLYGDHWGPLNDNASG